MIASLRGQVLSRTGGDIVLEVGNIGYLVAVPDRLAASVQAGEALMVHTAMVVRDDHVALFGFDSPEELQIFDLLRSVSGVGPKSALAILGLDDIPQPADAADALALAISEAWRGGGSPVVGAAGETPAQKAWREAEGRAGQPKLKE